DGATTDAVYGWCRKMGHGQVIAIKGVGGFDRSTPVDGPTYVDVTEGGRKFRRGVRLWKVAGAVFKSETYRFLRLAAPTDEDIAEGTGWPAGYVHIPKGTTAEWTKQLTAEQLMTIKTRQGFQRLEWQQTRDRNEALDCRVYARASAWLMGMDRWDAVKWDDLRAQVGQGTTDTRPAGQPHRQALKPPPPRPSGWLGNRPRGSWF
ncbi:MAG: phage terminase large subunit family protein, partial [Paracoccus sp. (in: a-proteobacteria)]|uniref:terminase gpA endonuclease subunit n=1 Tax=Paracoccus sp. TaxID=267 RepID=UPI0039E72371